ncbi:hemopexin repeat-containing protein [Frankia sp. Cj3]|uniref:hemopexin repeat-containing protein n=1 Tax=Frankia sp. Cj3 TaxID=2880976 RepID=UPI001EF44ABC|nr:hemopexin repeat-containing protein [Frankia sp. Cj3]
MVLVDALVNWPNGKVYFFSGADYYGYDIAGEQVGPGYPRPIAANWPGLGGVSIDSAIAWPNGKAYFFSGPDYYRYDIADDRIDPGFPLPVKSNWPGLMIFGATQIQAAVLWPNGSSYFFADNGMYYKWNVAADRIEPGYPKPIQGNWPGLWSSSLRGALVWPDPGGVPRKAYFFQRSFYMRYDITADAVDPDYPRPVSGNWRGL